MRWAAQAIVTIASCLKGEHDIHEWRNALNELSCQTKGEKFSDVFAQSQFSYDRLEYKKKVQHCFFYCALYPKNHEISKDELIDYWIFEELLDE